MNFCAAHRQQKEQGFTLVELAIVLMIIGLLIGGILRGQEILTNARLQATIKEMQSFSAAVDTFQDQYGMMPGDMNRATGRIPGCTGDNHCVNGNGNGTIGILTETWWLGDQAINSENTQFWKHLALAHLISGVTPNAAAQEWGRSHPVGPFSGGFTVITDLAHGAGAFHNGALIIRQHGDLIQQPIELWPSFSSKHMSYIDRKMDDAVPSTGSIRSKAAFDPPIANACEVAYEESREDLQCILSYLLRT